MEVVQQSDKQKEDKSEQEKHRDGEKRIECGKGKKELIHHSGFISCDLQVNNNAA